MRASLSRAVLTASLVLCFGACTVQVDDVEREEQGSPDSIDSHDEELRAAEAALARWAPLVTLPLVPVSAANLPDGKVLLWSAEDRFSFGNDTGRTYTVTFDPQTNAATERLVNETQHDMFCPGTANLPDGRILVNGGLSAPATSIFNPATGLWTRAANMNIPRAYQGTVPQHDGSVFTLGGSWNGGVGNKHGELWTEAAGWRRLSGVPIDPFLSVDPTRNFGMDSHLWLIPAGNGRIFHAGPGINMNWIDTQGNGRVSPVGRRSDDEFSINGGAVMFDTGRVLKAGGGPGYDSVTSNANAYVIELGSDVVTRKIASMSYRRAFHNLVVLPNGQVVVLGGATFAVGFSDNNSVLAPEIFDPLTETFTVLPPMAVPRNYHSIALLLPDGRVLSGGGGLCGNCAANHPDVQILSPPYLFNADGTPAVRPVITTAPTAANHGTVMTVVTDSPVTSFALVRSASTTHATNNDQRRLSLSFRETATNTYAVDVPSNPGWAVPGLYMLFAMNEQGVPSISRTVRIGAGTMLRVLPIDDQSATRDADTALVPHVSNPAAAILTFSADGLPPGLSVNPATGVISGAASSAGKFLSSIAVSDGVQTVSTEFTWTINEPGTTRYVLFEALSEVAGNPWTSMAELDLLDDNGQVLSRGGWTVTASSAELNGENGRAENAFDGNPATIWHSQYQGAVPAHPHSLRIDLGGAFRVAGFRYLPRQDAGNNGTIARYRVSLSGDGVSFGAPVSQGDLSTLGPVKSEKTVYFANLAVGKTSSQSSTYPNGQAARANDGNTNGVFAANSVSHTNGEANAFWEVDLGALHQTFGVRLYNRSDCCGDRLSNFYILASETPMAGRSLTQLLSDPNVSVVQVGGTSPAVALYPLAARARYVRVQLGGTNFLQLAEVEVYGRLAANRAPTLVQPSPYPLVLGAEVSYGLIASDPDGDVLTYAATGLPPGLSLNGATGSITGIAHTAGSYAVSASADDGRGGMSTRNFQWFVGLQPPVVNDVAAPPASAGSSVTYTAPATGQGNLEYSWNFGDGSGDTAYAASNTASHNYTAPGVHMVTVTVRNASGSSTSRTFMQAVLGPVTSGRGKASSPIALETRAGQSARLWVVNPDNDTVSVFDTVQSSKVSEINVGSAPRSLSIAPDGRVWVTNKEAGTVSVIAPSSLSVVQTIALPRASQPYGVVHAADGTGYVSLGALGRLQEITAAGVLARSLDVGANPRGLSLTPAGDQLLVTRFITPPQPGESTALIQTFLGPVAQGAEVRVVAPSSLTVTRTIVLRHSDKLDTTISARGVPNYLGAAAISPDGQSAWVPSKQDNIQRGTLRDGRNLDFENTVRAISSRIDLATGSEDYAARIDHDNSSQGSAALFHPNGVYLFVTLETSRHVAVVDAYGKRELFRIDVGRAPQGLTLSDNGRTLYVHNFMDRSVSVLSLARLLDYGQAELPLMATWSSVASERLSAQVLRGKQLFYDARDTRLARDGYMSCATCHNDGGQDGRVWDLTGMGEGLRNTISLRGRGGAPGRQHWTANFDEIQDFEGQIRRLNEGTGLMGDALFNAGTRSQPLGDAKAGQSADLDALAAYVNSLTSADASPLRTGTGALSSDAALGRTLFASLCASCHGGSNFSDSGSLALHNVGTLKATSGSRLSGALTGLDTPTLRDVWATEPYLHDGSAPTVEAAITAHARLSLSTTELASLAAFVRQIGSEEATVQPTELPGLTAHYFANRTLAGTPTAVRLENVDFDWGTGAPAAGVPADDFSVRWTGQIIAPIAGTYRLQTVTDDGVRLYVNGTLAINNWTDHGPTIDTSAAFNFTAGQRVDITLEYYERGGGATARLQWLVPGATSYTAVPVTQLAQTGSGLTGHYFANSTLSGVPALTRTEAVNFSWINAAPSAGIPADNYSVRWTGQLVPSTTGSHRLRTYSDDGVRLWLNGVLVVDNWTAHSPSADLSPALSLIAGQRYALVVEYQELTGQATMQLEWQTPGSGTYVSIPAARLYPTGAGLRGLYFANNALTGTAVRTRTEAVNFAWGNAAPLAGVPADNYSVRWTGQVSAPRTGAYRFQTTSDDGVRVWVNGVQLINNWTAHSPTVDTSATINLVAGQRYNITVEYQELGGDATMQLRWQTPGAPGFVAISASELHGP